MSVNPQPPITKGVPYTVEHAAEAWWRRVPGMPTLLLIGVFLMTVGAVVGFVAALIWKA